MPDNLKKHATKLEVKSLTSEGEIEGMGSLFDEEDSYGDIIRAGAFADTLKSGRSVKMLYQHSASQVIGVWDELEETPKGLRAKGRISQETELGRDTTAMIRMGAIDGLSIGFNIPKGGSEWSEEDPEIRIIRAIDLWELSVVTFPAAGNARIGEIRTQAEIDALDLRGIERALREASSLGAAEVKHYLHRIAEITRAREASLNDEAQAARMIAEMRASLG